MSISKIHIAEGASLNGTTLKSRNHASLAARARRDGRMMAVLLKVSPPRSDLKAFHRLFATLAAKYSRLNITEFESEYYRRIR